MGEKKADRHSSLGSQPIREGEEGRSLQVSRQPAYQAKSETTGFSKRTHLEKNKRVMEKDTCC